MRLRQSAFALLLFGAPLGACTVFGARADCENNPVLCEGGAGGTGGTTSGPTCTSPAGCILVGMGLPRGMPCGAGDACQSGKCVDGVCCDDVCGPCEVCNAPGHEGACSALDCDEKGGCGEKAGACRCEDGEQNGDETGVDCGGACGSCLGDPCSGAGGSECASGHCVDGRCCESSCDGPCVLCNAPGLLGLCAQVEPGLGGACELGFACDGAGACKKLGNQACSDPEECLSGNCAGSMNGVKKCKNCTLGDASSCPEKYVCHDNVACVVKVESGKLCHSHAECMQGTCVAGLCCSSDCTGTCMSCTTAYTGAPDGTCAPILAGLDPHDECLMPGEPTACSGQPADVNGQSSCGPAK